MARERPNLGIHGFGSGLGHLTPKTPRTGHFRGHTGLFLCSITPIESECVEIHSNHFVKFDAAQTITEIESVARCKCHLERCCRSCVVALDAVEAH